MNVEVGVGLMIGIWEQTHTKDQMNREFIN